MMVTAWDKCEVTQKIEASMRHQKEKTKTLKFDREHLPPSKVDIRCLNCGEKIFMPSFIETFNEGSNHFENKVVWCKRCKLPNHFEIKTHYPNPSRDLKEPFIEGKIDERDCLNAGVQQSVITSWQREKAGLRGL